MTLACCVSAVAADVDPSKLPPPATNPVEFTRDIKPIFERSCIRCHGPERPKSRFSLADRDSALKGGDNGVDILPGESAKSPLIHHVAGLVTDAPMPPEGKGEPLTPAEIGLLRKWIDDGAVWQSEPPGPKYSLTMAPTLGWTTVNGDEKKFRELNWRPEGWSGGAEEFLLTDKYGKHSQLTLTGHALLDDYRVALSLENPDVGFTRFGWEQFAKYSDDTGGYMPTFNPSIFSLNRDLRLDVGRAWADFGLTLPHWPRLVFGYEYDYRSGEKATLQWGPVGNQPAQLLTDPDYRNIYPAYKTIDERVHIIKFDFDYDLAGYRIEDNFRGEFNDLQTHRVNMGYYSIAQASPTLVNNIQEGTTYFQGANTIRVDKSLTDWWLASIGYLYSKLDADAAFNLDATVSSSPPAGYNNQWNTQDMTVERQSQVFNFTSLLGPWEGFTLSAGVLSEWNREESLGSALQPLYPLAVDFPNFGFDFPYTLSANSDETKVGETVALRYTTIPYTTLFGEARFQQDRFSQFEDQTGGQAGFTEDVLATTDRSDYRAGFNTSPWRRISLSAQYRHVNQETDYNHLQDRPPEGYPAFITWRDVTSDEVEAKLAWTPRPWLKTSFSYAYDASEFRTATDPAPGEVGPELASEGGRLVSSFSVANRYSFNTSLAPWQRLSLSGTFSYLQTYLSSFANDNPAIVPYRGDLYSLLTSATYMLNDKTDLHGNYSFSWANYAQNNFDAGLPVGIRYQQHALTLGLGRRLSKNASAKLQYGFYYYDEPSNGGANNYIAHSVFATFVMRLP